MTFFISIRYFLEFFLFKIIIFLLFPFSKKMSSKIISNLFIFLGNFQNIIKLLKIIVKWFFLILMKKKLQKL